MSNIKEIKARDGKVISIVNDPQNEAASNSDDVIVVPPTMEELSPILNVVPLQLFAYYIAIIKKLDVDKPRNLAKSVTVE